MKPELKWISEFPAGPNEFAQSNPPLEPYYFKRFIAMWHVCTMCLRFFPDPRGEALKCPCGKIGDITVRRLTLRSGRPRDLIEAAQKIRELGPSPFADNEVVDLDQL
jgi:hypothetical protein